jgi:hypothetical protein
MQIAVHRLAAAQITIALVLSPMSGLGQACDNTPQQPSTSNTKTTSNTSILKVAADDDLSRPLPDIATILHKVEMYQRAAETVQKNYLYRSVETAQEVDSHGSVKKATSKEYEDFWLSGVPVHRLLKKDGNNLSAEEEKREGERIDKAVAKSLDKRTRAEAAGKETDPRGNEEITVSRFLELGHFTNARRITLSGRDTIVVEFTGDPQAKTRNRSEEVIRDLVGKVWIDERDLMLSRIEGHFLNSFKIGGGLLMNIRKDTSFGVEFKKINDEVWLPTRVNGQGAARALLFFNFNGKVQIVYSDYRKFKATSTILPGLSTIVQPEVGEPR